MTSWNCFRCGTVNENRVLQCPKCNDMRLHSENMRRSLGMDAMLTTKKCKRSGEEMAKRRLLKEKYESNKGKFENIVTKYFNYFVKIRLFKDKEGDLKKPEETLYYGFDREGFHYTVRRDKI